MHSQAFLWSLSYWQTESASVSVGAVVFDSCERKDQLVQNVLGFEQCNLRVSGISRHNVVGFVGPTDNMAAMAAAPLTADMHLTLISPGADSRRLSDAKKFPYFLRTTPTLQRDVEIMADTLKHVGTKFVALIYGKDSYQDTVDAFRDRMKDENICVSGSYALTGEQSDAAMRDFVRGPLADLQPTRFVALFLPQGLLMRFLNHVSAQAEVRSMNLVFLMTSQVRRSADIFRGQHAVAASDAIILERKEPDEVKTAVEEFKKYWKQDTILTNPGRISDPFLLQYLTAGHRLPEVDVDVAYTIMATKAFMEGIRRAGRDAGCSTSAYLCPQFFNSSSRGSNVYRAIRSATTFFTPADVQGKFADGDLRKEVIDFNIFRYNMNGSFSQIGEYRNGVTRFSRPIQGLPSYGPGQCQDTPCPQCPLHSASTTSASISPSTTRAPRDRCLYDYGGENMSRVLYPPHQDITGAYLKSARTESRFATRYDIDQQWIIALGVLAGLGVVSVVVFEVYVVFKLLGSKLGLKWRTMWLGQLLLLGVLLCYLTLLAFLFIPTKATCGITRFGVGVSCSVCFAVLLVKLMVILTSKSSLSSYVPGDVDNTNYLRGIYQFLMFIFVVGVQVVIDTQWLITVPPDAVKVVSNAGHEVWVCNHYTFSASRSPRDMAGFVRSEFENHVMSLVYVMFLILVTTLLALRAHGIITNHRESVFIGIAAGFCIPIWVAWTLVGGLNKDHDYAHEFGDACIAFGLFLTATLVLFAMFLPKVRQLVNMGVEGIYFEDDHDTVYAGSVIMAPSYKAPNSVIYVNNQGMHSEPVVVSNEEGVSYIQQPVFDKPTSVSTYSAPPIYLKKGGDSTRSGNILRVTDDLSGRRPLEKKRATSEMGPGAGGRPQSTRGTLPRSRFGAL